MQALQCYKLLKRKVELKLDDPKIFKFYTDFKFEYNRIMYIIIWLVYYCSENAVIINGTHEVIIPLSFSFSLSKKLRKIVTLR